MYLVQEPSSMTTLRSIPFSGCGFPTDEGLRLADLVLQKNDVDLSDLEIDLMDCASALLISAFFNAFLQRVHEQQPTRLDDARTIQWKLKFDFQHKNVDNWMKNFRPFDADH
jgi:hypothetical protein